MDNRSGGKGRSGLVAQGLGHAPDGEVVRGQGGRTPDHLGEPFEAVLAAAQEGAGWAATRLWVSLASPVAGYLRAQGAEEPEDLTSEVFLGVFRSLGTFSGSEEQLRSWVFTIAHRRLTDARRRAGRRPPPAWGSEVEDGPPGPSAEHQALRRLSAERVRVLCGRLVPDQRDVLLLLLRLVGGLTVEEVSAILDKSAERRSRPSCRVGPERS